ncbi:MAG: lactonase family protein [Pirellulales bacterium]|nr:lactonase family protein [Pirellulales bacterium]
MPVQTTCALAALLVASFARLACAEETLLYVGTYTRGTASRGIYALRFDAAAGTLAPGPVTTGVENPSFLALDPAGATLYSSDEVNEYEGKPSGAVTAFRIDRDAGTLELVNRQPAGGTSPCHLAVDGGGKNVLVVGYGSGTVGVLPTGPRGALKPLATLLTHEGSSVDPARQASPHPHQIELSPDGRFAFVPDLGLDRIVQYRFDAAAGTLEPNDPPFAATAPGAGPRHMAFHPDGRRAYSINELDLTIDQFDFDPRRGVLGNRRTVDAMPASADRAGVSGAEIAVHPKGDTLYASLRCRDEIVVFRLEPATGEPTFLERVSTGGKTPRHFTFSPGGQWLLAANQNSGTITVFRIAADGRLQATDEQANVPAPVCLLFAEP